MQGGRFEEAHGVLLALVTPLASVSRALEILAPVLNPSNLSSSADMGCSRAMILPESSLAHIAFKPCSAHSTILSMPLTAPSSPRAWQATIATWRILNLLARLRIHLQVLILSVLLSTSGRLGQVRAARQSEWTSVSLKECVPEVPGIVEEPHEAFELLGLHIGEDARSIIVSPFTHVADIDRAQQIALSSSLDMVAM